MKFKLLLLFVAASIFSFTACDSKNQSDELTSPIAQEKITQYNLETIASKIAADSSFSLENMQYFINALTRLGANKDSVVGKTVGELINGQKKLVKDGVLETLTNTGSRINLFVNHTFQYAGMSFNDEKKDNKIDNIHFNVLNTSDKAIKSIKGRLVFYTANGELLKIYDIATATEIPAKSEKAMAFIMPFQHNDANQRDKIMRESSNLRTVWTPTYMEFADGTKIEDKATKTEQATASK